MKITTIAYNAVLDNSLDQDILFHLLPVLSDYCENEDLDKRKLPRNQPLGTIVSVRYNGKTRGCVKKGNAVSRSLISGEISDGKDNYNFSICNNNIFTYAPNYEKASIIFEHLLKKINTLSALIEKYKQTRSESVLKKITPFYRYEGEQNWIVSITIPVVSILEVKETMCNGNFIIHGEIILDNLRDLFRKFGWKAYYWDKISNHITISDNNSSSCIIRKSNYASMSGQNTEDMKRAFQKIKSILEEYY